MKWLVTYQIRLRGAVEWHLSTVIVDGPLDEWFVAKRSSDRELVVLLVVTIKNSARGASAG